MQPMFNRTLIECLCIDISFLLLPSEISKSNSCAYYAVVSVSLILAMPLNLPVYSPLCLLVVQLIFILDNVYLATGKIPHQLKFAYHDYVL